jgi:hypothetical protein
MRRLKSGEISDLSLFFFFLRRLELDLSRRVRDLRRLASIGATERLKLVESDLKHLANASTRLLDISQ